MNARSQRDPMQFGNHQAEKHTKWVFSCQRQGSAYHSACPPTTVSLDYKGSVQCKFYEWATIQESSQIYSNF